MAPGPPSNEPSSRGFTTVVQGRVSSPAPGLQLSGSVRRAFLSQWGTIELSELIALSSSFVMAGVSAARSALQIVLHRVEVDAQRTPQLETLRVRRHLGKPRQFRREVGLQVSW
uniref:Uncharacterized protein n=1 Tax=Anopheles merus TaxID=30066 RepID=A0A182V835_ANOME